VLRSTESNRYEHFPPAEIAAKIAVSLGIGLLVGIEREWSNKDLGARTFALIALLGALAVLVAPSMAIMSSVGVFLIIIIANIRSLIVERSLAATTSAALLVTFVLGALVGQGHLFTPVAAAILMTMLLTAKGELHRFAGGLLPAEIRSAVLLGLLGFVVYPLLPNRFIDKWDLINPRQAWLTVIVIAGIGFVNYLLLNVYGARGLYLSGFLGGFVNSSTAAVELAKPLVSANTPPTMAVGALLLTIIAMFLRNLILLALFAPSAAWYAALPILAMATAALVFAVHSKTDGNSQDIHLQSPVSLKRVLSFALLFLAIQIVATLSERHLGRFGFLVISALGGFISSASTSAAAANMVGHNQLPANLASAAVVLASVTSALVNLPIIHRTAKNPGVSRKLSVVTLLLAGLGTLILVLQHYAMHFKR